MFEYTLNILSARIHEIGSCNPKAKELQQVIQILRDGQGYLTKDNHIKIIFYDDNASK